MELENKVKLFHYSIRNGNFFSIPSEQTQKEQKKEHRNGSLSIPGGPDNKTENKLQVDKRQVEEERKNVLFSFGLNFN